MAVVAEKWQSIRVRHEHKHSPIVNVNVAHEQQLTWGERASDGFASAVGSWRFIVIQSVLLVAWIILNIAAWIRQWDPYPFILLNLALSFQAAYAVPIIMMSQNRQATKDRLAAEQDYVVNTTAEEELKNVMRHLEAQDDLMIDILHKLEEQHQEILARASIAPAPASPTTGV
jgi:uncharacterized membrane protein